MNAPWQPVLDFWFLPAADPGHGKPRPEWFRKDARFDHTIIERFGKLIEQALAGALDSWQVELRGALAHVVVLDQFTRNAFRDTARAFAGDRQALAAARRLVEQKLDRQLVPVERWFAYMPYEHAEDSAMQDQALAHFTQLEAESEMTDLVSYANRHRDIIRRFGRFPHRNRLLGRTSTPEEEEFLRQPGSGF